jgi:predicted nucleic acid-binding Zn ribbon protein
MGPQEEWYTGGVAERYIRHPNTTCSVCSKPVYRRPVEIERGRVFCSKECYGIACRKESPCAVCGTPILANKHRKTCSRACSNTHRTGVRYNRGRPKDKVKDQRAAKLRVLAVRGQKCERCGYDKKEILNIHHKDRNRKNNDLDNLELLCPNCHAEEHYLKNSWLSDTIKN